jgi:hypothetical protein
MAKEKRLPAFPYSDLRLTDEQKQVLLERIEKNRDLLTDALGLSGHLMMLDDASVANIAAHYALAGVGYLGEEHSFIWGKRAAPDDTGMWRVEVEWLVKREHPEEPQEETDEAEAAKLREQLVATTPPGLLAALKRQLIEEAELEDRKAEEAGDRLTEEGTS